MTVARWVDALPEGLRITTGEVPEPDAGEALIRSVYVGICGSDMHAVAGHHPFVPLPYRPGHEVVAVVERLGGSATSGTGALGATVVPGARVVVEPPLWCGSCKNCVAGRTNLCENMDFYGCGASQGGMAELSVIRTDRLHVLPDAMTFEQAALVEPLATPVHAIRLAARSREGERPDLSGAAVVIIGAGTIGLSMLAAVRWAGARRVVVTDPLEVKRERALRGGADAVVDATAPDVVDQVRSALGESADVVFDCVSVQQTVDQAVALAFKGGTVMTVGVPVAPVTVDLPSIQDVQIGLQGSITYTAADYATAIEIISSGALSPDDLITLVAPLDDVEEAFTAARSGNHLKVLIRP